MTRQLRPGPDQEVRHVLEAADGFVPVKQGVHGAAHLARGAAVGADGTADQAQGEVVGTEVGELADRSNPVDLGRPVVLVKDLHQPDVQVDVYVLPRPLGVHLLEQAPPELA